MAPPFPTSTLGSAEGLPAPPFDPRAMDSLLRHRPERAARLLAAMHPQQRRAQLLAHADLAEAPPARIKREWGELLRLARPADLDDPPPVSVIEPERLALMETEAARAAVANLGPTQRVAQAVAQAAWLAGSGYDVSFEELLASWEASDERIAA